MKKEKNRDDDKKKESSSEEEEEGEEEDGTSDQEQAIVADFVRKELLDEEKAVKGMVREMHAIQQAINDARKEFKLYSEDYAFWWKTKKVQQEEKARLEKEADRVRAEIRKSLDELYLGKEQIQKELKQLQEEDEAIEAKATKVMDEEHELEKSWRL